MTRTIVHLLRHGEVENPEGILYGRLPGYRLSALGERMAERVAERIGQRDITAVVASPLERAQQTATPLATVRALELGTDERLIESGNVFEGKPFALGDGVLLNPPAWRYLWNPFKPSWGEPYREVAHRMWAAVLDARAANEGHEAVLVSHQLPVWITRLLAEGRRFVHNPRTRQCTLASLTSLTFDGEHLVSVGYSEPAGDLIPAKDRKQNFSSGGKR
ncbi:histidine phosphatase family protein [Nocardioides mangrovicus]|uniref:Histidine phosphatase family protein n=1 Tax=Nocardioides mangrovicus TaxID=2478913 RepID=A0A3L8P538_9ACTN|nr:histidine phosphatase family protein [Nocardioides mangrovicus]RLV50496.1 histidine phosphatase family protein [Nocardioides mangrovicus]